MKNKTTYTDCAYFVAHQKNRLEVKFFCRINRQKCCEVCKNFKEKTVILPQNN